MSLVAKDGKGYLFCLDFYNLDGFWQLSCGPVGLHDDLEKKNLILFR